MAKTYLLKSDETISRIFSQIVGIRKYAKKTQEDVSKALGMTKQGYQQIEARKSMSLKQFLEVCEELGVDPAEIVWNATNGGRR